MEWTCWGTQGRQAWTAPPPPPHLGRAQQLLRDGHGAQRVHGAAACAGAQRSQSTACAPNIPPPCTSAHLCRRSCRRCCAQSTHMKNSPPALRTVWMSPMSTPSAFSGWMRAGVGQGAGAGTGELRCSGSLQGRGRSAARRRASLQPPPPLTVHAGDEECLPGRRHCAAPLLEGGHVGLVVLGQLVEVLERHGCGRRREAGSTRRQRRRERE